MSPGLLYSMPLFVLTSTESVGDISGTWKVDMKSPSGEDESFGLDIKAEGENLQIICSNHPKFQKLEGGGTFKGDEINMNIKVAGTMPLEIVFKGNLSGSKMSGTREIIIGEGAPPPQGTGKGAPPTQGTGKGEPPPPPPKGTAQGEVSNVFTAEMI